ncbi:tRNA-dihydrouridine synthase family protein [Lachnospiraceae bacterium 62-35]
MIKYYFAPMEGITWHVYRNAHYQVFPGIETYYTPFIVPSSKRGIRSRELRDVLPESNPNHISVIPQILTNRAEDFLETARKLQDLGYEKVNLNLGCPSGTVAAKGKGSGFLADREGLNRFLEQVISGLDMKLSIKTRIGVEHPEEFQELLRIYNQYPLEMLIIHPRVRADYYRNTPDMKAFGYGMKESRNPVCYNGDITCRKNIAGLIDLFPEIEHVMIGRGLIANPALVRELTGGMRIRREELREFHDLVYDGYRQIILEDRNVLFRMKELWAYMTALFEDKGKCGKKIRKSQKLSAYEACVEELFSTCSLKIQD